MIAKNINYTALSKAMGAINERYDGNIAFERCESLNHDQTRYRFRLRVLDSKNPDHRRGHSGRRMPHACWHVHGHFFEALLAQAPTAVIRSNGLVIDQDGGNWQDRNIGSVINPMFFSEACDC